MMEIQDLKRNVNCLLTISGIRKDVEKEQLQLLFYHQLMTVSLFDSLTDEEREMVKKLNRRFKNFFASKFSVKERKARKEKKSLPQTPSKDIETERIDKEMCVSAAGANADFEVRREAFRQECLSFTSQFDEQRVADFYFYWSEASRRGKMRFERQKYWNIENRLKLWARNQYASDITSAALRLERLKARQASDAVTRQAVSEQQAQHAQERRQANERLEQEIEQRKQGAVSYKEYLEMKGEKAKNKGDHETG